MPTQTATLSSDVLNAALAGLEAQKQTLEQHIQQVRSMLGIAPRRRGRPPKSAASTTGTSTATMPAQKRRKRSPEVRARMAAAQRKRWAALKAGEEPESAAPKKRTLSAAARKRMSEATKKRWAAYRRSKARS